MAPGEGSADDSVTAFLLKAMDPPHLLSIRNAISLLQVLHMPAVLLTGCALNHYGL